MVALAAAEAVVLVLLTVLVAGLLRSHGVILQALHELGVNLDPSAVGHGHRHGAPAGVPERSPRASGAPGVAGVTPGGDALAVTVALPGTWTLLAFLSGTCLTCRTFWQDLGTPGRTGLPRAVRVVIVSKSAGEEDRAVLAGLAPPTVPAVMSPAPSGRRLRGLGPARRRIASGLRRRPPRDVHERAPRPPHRRCCGPHSRRRRLCAGGRRDHPPLR